MDIKLKGKTNGIETAYLLKENYDIPVVYVTAYADEGNLARIKETEPLGIISKPFSNEELINVIETALHKYKMEKKLKESEKNLRTTLNSIGDAVISTDIAGNVISMNPIAEQLIGYTFEEARQKPLIKIFNIINGKTRKRVANPVEKVMKKGETVGLANHTILISRDGTEYQIADSGSPIRDDNGNIKGVVLVFRDVTEEYKIQMKLRENEQRLSAIYESSPIVITVSSLEDGRYIEVNKAFTQFTGWKNEEVIGKKAFDLNIWAEPAKEQRQDLINEFKKRGSVRNREYIFQDKNGNKKTGLLSAEIIIIEGKKYILSNVVNVTERKKTEKALRKSEGKYRTLVESADDMIYIVDKDLTFLYGNYKYLKRNEMTFNELMGKNYGDTHSDIGTEKFRKKVQTVCETGKPITYEYLSERDNRYFLRTISPSIDNKTGEIESITIISKDMTQQKLTEKELKKSELTLRSIFGAMTEPVLEIDYNGKIINIAPVSENFLYKSKEEVMEKSLHEFFPKAKAEKCLKAVQECLDKNKTVHIEYSLEIKGELKWFEGRVNPKTKDSVIYIIRDITERKKMEKRMTHLNAVLHGIRSVNQLITHEKDQNQLIQEICNTLVETQGYESTWVVLYDEKMQFSHFFESGIGKEFDTFIQSFTDSESVYCVKRALKRNGSVSVRNVEKVCTGCPLQRKSLNTRALTIRLEHKKQIFGVMSVNVPVEYVNDKEGQELFSEIAADISFALYGIKAENERRKVMEALQESEKRYRNLIEFSPDPIVIHSEGKIQYINNAGIELAGEALKENLIGKPVINFVHPDSRRVAIKNMKVILEKNKTTRGIEEKFLDINGNIINVEVSGRKIMYNNRPAVQLIIRDISERKQAEETIERSEERFKQFFNEALTGNYISTPEGKILLCNEMFVKITDYDSVQEVYRIKAESFYPKVETRNLMLKQLQKKKRLLNIESRMKRKDGSVVTVLENIIGEFDGKDNLIRIKGYMFDITKRKKAEEQIKKDLEEKSILLKEVHHRVKNNLQIMRSLINIQKMEEKNPEFHDCATELSNRINSMAMIHEQLYKSENMAEINIKNYFESFLSKIMQSYTVSNINLEKQIEDVHLPLDQSVPIGLIVNELLTNAVKHAFPEKRKGKITISLSKQSNTCILQIQDNGVGMLNEIDFENPDTLGLKLVSILTEQLEGTIQSYKQKGTLIKLMFPIVSENP